MILVKIWKWLKLLISFPFIKKTFLNHLYIWIWSFWVIFTALQWMKTNFKISKFSRFQLRSKYTIQVKFENDWNILILFHSSRKHLKSSLHLNLIILTAFHSFKVNEDKLLNQSIWRFLLTSRYAILVKISKWLKLLNTVQFIKKTLVNHLYFWIWSFWLPFTASQWIKANFKISQFEDFC